MVRYARDVSTLWYVLPREYARYGTLSPGHAQVAVRYARGILALRYVAWHGMAGHAIAVARLGRPWRCHVARRARAMRGIMVQKDHEYPMFRAWYFCFSSESEAVLSRFVALCARRIHWYHNVMNHRCFYVHFIDSRPTRRRVMV